MGAQDKGMLGLRYDAGVIGAGADGLVAATLLARAGLKTVLFERNAEIGGRLVTREFHPGFHASPFSDTIAEIPPEIFWSFDLARRGVLFLPETVSTAMWFERHHTIRMGSDDGSAFVRAFQTARAFRDAIFERANADTRRKPAQGFFARRAVPIWPGSDWAKAALTDLSRGVSADDADHLAAAALEGRIAMPEAQASALHLLAGGAMGRIAGGAGVLGAALGEAAREAGVEIITGLEVSDIRQARHCVIGVTLADGVEIETSALISTLDLKRTFLSLFSWSALPKELVARAGNWRMGPGRARLLLALARAPSLTEPALSRGPIHLAPDMLARAKAHAALRGGVVPDVPPATLRFVSAADPRLAPSGGATATLTLSGIPYRLFDGGWTHEKRDALRAQALKLLDAVLPGLSDQVVGTDLIVPPDFEEALGVTEGDLDGGEIAPDQMLGFRPFLEPRWRDNGPRAPVRGLYLAGPSAPAGLCGTGTAGMFAAQALLFDRGVFP